MFDKSPRPIKLSAVDFANISDAKLSVDIFMFDKSIIPLNSKYKMDKTHGY